MSEADCRRRELELPRDEAGLAQSTDALRRLSAILPAFLDDAVVRADADGLVVALDGGTASAVTATMAVEAVGADAVTGVITPAGLTDEAQASDAAALASALNVDYRRLQLQPLVIAFQKAVGASGEPADDLVAVENAVDRFRMACLYYLADTTDRLVVGSLSRTDLLLGLVAKHGADAVDLAPLADCYRTEVRALADFLDVPADLVTDDPSRTRHTAPTDVTDLDIGPETLDSILRRLVDLDRSPATIATELDVPTVLVERVRTWYDRSAQERRGPLSPAAVE